MNQIETSSSILRIALPKRGRIADQLGPLCKDAGYEWPSRDASRALFARIDKNIEVMFVRTTDIPSIVADGVVDIGITGTDVVEEAGANVSVIQPLPLFQCRMVVAAPPEWNKNFRDNPPQSIRVATSFPNHAKKWGEKVGIDVHIISLSGAVEIAPRAGIADAIVDLTQTGASLRSNGLEEVETISDVEACFVSSPDFDITDGSNKAYQASTFCDALVSVLNAKGKRYLMMNVPKNVADQVRDLVPGLSSPTVLDLFGNDDVVAIQAVVDADKLNALIPQLRDLGVHGILVTHIERLIP